MPPIYVWEGPEVYPQRIVCTDTRTAQPVGNTYFIIIDSTDEGKRRELERIRGMQVPYGRCDQIGESMGIYIHSQNSEQRTNYILQAFNSCILETGWSCATKTATVRLPKTLYRSWSRSTRKLI